MTNLAEQQKTRQELSYFLPSRKSICQNGPYLSPATKRAFTVSHPVLYATSRASHVLWKELMVAKCGLVANCVSKKKKKGLPIPMVTKTTNPNKIMGVGPFGGFL